MEGLLLRVGVYSCGRVEDPPQSALSELPSESVLAAGPGFEPGLEDPKSSVLPLHNPALNLVPKVGLEPTRESPPNSF
jgi:hypothetical protein